MPFQVERIFTNQSAVVHICAKFLTQRTLYRGSTSGVEAGQTVTITFGGKTYTTTVAANGSWSTTVPAVDMATLRDGNASAQVRVTNVNGNSATATHEYSV
ncbi:hypothetical protein KX754_24555, partial [Escherichia coli]|nr:hypothetical protein [Escherichia coli]